MQTCRSTVLTKSWTTPTKFTKLCRFTSHGRRRHWANAFLMTSLFTCSQQTLFSLTLPSLSSLFLFFLKHRSQTGRRYGRAINSWDSKLKSGLGCLDWIICSLQLHDYLFHHANGSNYHNCEEWKFYHACSLGYHWNECRGRFTFPLISAPCYTCDNYMYITVLQYWRTSDYNNLHPNGCPSFQIFFRKINPEGIFSGLYFRLTKTKENDGAFVHGQF